MQRYARYWGEDDERSDARERREGRGYERGGYERWGRRGYGERGGWGGREPERWRGRREWHEAEPYDRDWRDSEPYRVGRRDEPWDERGYRRGPWEDERSYRRWPREDERSYRRWPREDERGMPRGYYGGWRRGWAGERSPYGYGRPPMEYEMERRGPMGERWGEPREEGEPGLMARIGEGIRNIFGGGEERGPYAGKGPKGYRRSDERIREDVCDRIASWGWVDASDVEVRVQDGEVTLAGQVGARRDKRLLEEMIEDVPGVLDVHNQVRVRRDGGQRPAAETIRGRDRTA